jgi:acyl CoA:acetate/3-ketoacid CoA transferase
LVKAWKGDKEGNLVFRGTTRNFNEDAAKAGKITIVEVEELVEPGEIHPDEIHVPGVFVQRIYKSKNLEKRIEKRTLIDKPVSKIVAYLCICYYLPTFASRHLPFVSLQIASALLNVLQRN